MELELLLDWNCLLVYFLFIFKIGMSIRYSLLVTSVCNVVNNTQ